MPNSTTSKQPKIVVMVANIVFALGVVGSLLIFSYTVYKIFSTASTINSANAVIAFLMGDIEWLKPTRTFYLITISVGILSAVLFGLGLRLKDNIKVNLSLLIVTTGITVYATETFLEISQQRQDRIEIENISGISIDERKKIEVLVDLKEQGIEAYPNIPPSYLLSEPSTRDGLIVNDEKILPFGGISNRMMVQKNENGYWMMYVGDRYGFHNPDVVYDADAIDIIMTGDSFTEGWAVRSDENISAVLRTFGWNVINLGKGGNGPLLEYATLKEYAETLKPKIVLWQYFENDVIGRGGESLGELDLELKSALLTRYLNEDEFSQNLISRQGEIDSVLIQHAAEESFALRQKEITKREVKRGNETGESREIDQQNLASRNEFTSRPLMKILKLRNLRKMVDLVPEPGAETNPELETATDPTKETPLKAAFKQTLEKAYRLVSSWNGSLYFVYLPQRWITLDIDHPWREVALRSATELGLPIIDIQNDVFASHPDPLSLFPFRNSYFHYNAKGYRLVAEAIANRLKADGVLQ